MPTSWLPFGPEAFFHPRRLRSLRTDGSASMFPSVFGDGTAWGRLYVTLVCATAPAERAAARLCCTWKPMFLTHGRGSCLLAVPIATLGGNRVFPPTVWAQPWKTPVVLKFQAPENPGFALVLFLLSEPLYCSVVLRAAPGVRWLDLKFREQLAGKHWRRLSQFFLSLFLSLLLFFSVCFFSQPHRFVEYLFIYGIGMTPCLHLPLSSLYLSWCMWRLFLWWIYCASFCIVSVICLLLFTPDFWGACVFIEMSVVTIATSPVIPH